MQLSKVQAEMILKNLRERMNVKLRKYDGQEYCKVAVKLTSAELQAFDLALNSLKMEKLDIAERIVNKKILEMENGE